MDAKLKQAISRSLNEITLARNELTAYYAILKCKPRLFPDDFIGICSIALYNDYISHLIKVLDTNDKSLTFIHIYNSMKDDIDLLLYSINKEIEPIKEIISKLKKIRNHTHFHLDCNFLHKPQDVWESANIKSSEIENAIDCIQFVLLELYKKHISNLEEPYVKYDGWDAEKIVELVLANGPKRVF